MKICLSCDQRFEAGDWVCPRCHYAPCRQQGAILFAAPLLAENDGFNARHFRQLAELEAGHFWFRNRNRLLIWALRAYFPATRRFLEIGCGTGFVLSGIQAAMDGLELAGSDLFLEGLSFARDRLPGVPLYRMDATQIPFEAEFDVVGAFDVLEHIGADEAVLRQMHRAIKSGGGLILTVPQHPSLWSAADVCACHKRRYARHDLVRKIESAGFKPLRVTSFMTSLLPLMWLSRRLKSRTTEIAMNAEFHVNPALNKIFETALRLESWLIQRGGSFPAGGSLLVVAQKI